MSDFPAPRVATALQFVQGTRVTTEHFHRTIVGTVIGIEARGIFSVRAVNVDWDEFGPNWESPGSLELEEV
jgi:hypothetical protein